MIVSRAGPLIPCRSSGRTLMVFLLIALRAASSVGGQILGADTGLISARLTAKPLHPRGHVVAGTLHRFGIGTRAPRHG